MDAAGKGDERSVCCLVGLSSSWFALKKLKKNPGSGFRPFEIIPVSGINLYHIPDINKKRNSHHNSGF